jgi:hypothetical protein
MSTANSASFPTRTVVAQAVPTTKDVEPLSLMVAAGSIASGAVADANARCTVAHDAFHLELLMTQRRFLCLQLFITKQARGHPSAKCAEHGFNNLFT